MSLEHTQKQMIPEFISRSQVIIPESYGYSIRGVPRDNSTTVENSKK